MSINIRSASTYLHCPSSKVVQCLACCTCLPLSVCFSLVPILILAECLQQPDHVCTRNFRTNAILHTTAPKCRCLVQNWCASCQPCTTVSNTSKSPQLTWMADTGQTSAATVSVTQQHIRKALYPVQVFLCCSKHGFLHSVEPLFRPTFCDDGCHKGKVLAIRGEHPCGLIVTAAL